MLSYFWDKIGLELICYYRSYMFKELLNKYFVLLFFQALCRVFSTLSSRIPLYLSIVRTGWITTGLFHWVFCVHRVWVKKNFLLFDWCTCCQAFARLSAVYGGTYMLNKPQCKVITPTISSSFQCLTIPI